MKQEELNKLKENISKAKLAIAELSNNYKKKYSKADGMGDCENKDCCPPKDDYLYWFTEYLYKYIQSVDDSMWRYISNHSEGHLPPIYGADKMTEALKALGIEKDYEVLKTPIYASSNRRGLTINL